jgi:hypothetical protein
MILPKGKVKHQDLMTSYTDLPALLSTLKSEGFSGTIEIEFPENKGVILIDTGEVINGEAEVGGDLKRMIGPEAVQYLLALSSQKDGVLNIYQLLPEQVAIVASNLRHEILFKELSTDFTRFDRLLLKLREEKHHGFIEVFAKNHEATGVLFLQEGEPTEMFTTPKSGPSVFGRKSIPTFVENAIREGAILSVYRTLGKISKVETKEEAKEETKEEAKEETKEETKEEIKEEEIKEEKIAEGGAEDLKELILTLQEILSKVENSVDGIFQKGKFLGAFKKSLLDKSDLYPFLDPFGSEFEYREGKIQFTGDAADKDLAQGVIECLRATLLQLARELPKNRILSLKLRTQIETSLKPYQESVKRLGLDAALSSFF